MPVSPEKMPEDGTRQLLQWGASIVGAGLLAALLLQTLLGGYSPTGASTNAGWFALIVALTCVPFGGLLWRSASPNGCAIAVLGECDSSLRHKRGKLSIDDSLTPFPRQSNRICPPGT